MIVLKGGTLIDGTGAAPVRDATLVIEDGRIESVTGRGRAGPGPRDAEVIDVAGLTVLPGLDRLPRPPGVPRLRPRSALGARRAREHASSAHGPGASRRRSPWATRRSATPAGSMPASARRSTEGLIRGPRLRDGARHHLAHRRHRRPREPLRPRLL